MPSLSRLALVIALLPCHACFVDLGVGDNSDASTSGDPSAGTSTTTVITTTSANTSEPITSSSDPSAPSDPTNDDADDDDTADDDTTAPASCGDGILDKEEACDEGPDNGPDRPCTPECQKNVCGDGYQAADEACDDHNLTNGDGCTATCLPETCGDGIIAAPTESCEDGNDVKGDGCRECQLESLRVFVTAATFTGDLMNTSLADTTCADEAATAQLPGTYLAWLSTVDFAAPERFNAGELAYVRTDDLVFANSLTNLIMFGPQLPLTYLASGQPLLAMKDICRNHVWTGTAANGESTPQWTCDSFTSPLLEYTGTVGNFNSIDGEWTDACQYQCNQTARLYCFEQIP